MPCPSVAVRLKGTLLSLSIVVAGCTETTSPTDGLRQHEPAYTEDDEYVQWNGNTVEFTADDGTEVRFVRDQQNLTKLWVYADDELAFVVNISGQGGTIYPSKSTDAVTSKWAAFNSSGHITSVSYGMGCIPEDDPECEYPEFGLIDDCSSTAYALVAAGASFVAAGIGAGASLALTGTSPFTAWTLKAVWTTGLATIGAVAAHAYCIENMT